MKYDYNDLMISEALNPNTETVSFVYALYVRRTNDLNWRPYYLAESYDEAGLEEVKEFAKAWHPNSKVRLGGYVYDAKDL